MRRQAGDSRDAGMDKKAKQDAKCIEENIQIAAMRGGR